jgi:hypothetical protein
MRRLFRSLRFSLLLLTACHSGACDGASVMVITIKDLDPKLGPSAPIVDGATKDVVIQTRAAFKPSKGGSAQVARRLRIKSKTETGAGGLASGVQMAGDVTARVRVAVDSLVGLVDGASLGYLERQPIGAGSTTRVEAVWNADIDGFTAQAITDGTPTGTPFDLPGAHEVVLWIVDSGPNLQLEASVATGDGLSDVGPSNVLDTVPQDVADTAGTFSVGAEALGRKGSVWLAQFTLLLGDDAATGEVELPASVALATSWYWLGQSLDVIDTNPDNVNILLSTLGSAFTPLFDEEAALQQGQTDGTLLPTTNAKEALHSSLDARIQLTAAILVLDKLAEKGKTDGSAIRPQLEKARDFVEVALACVHGFKKSGHSKLAKTVDVSIE